VNLFLEWCGNFIKDWKHRRQVNGYTRGYEHGMDRVEKLGLKTAKTEYEKTVWVGTMDDFDWGHRDAVDARFNRALRPWDTARKSRRDAGKKLGD